MQEKVGFIGLGAMGAPMVLRLLHAGHRVVVMTSIPTWSVLDGGGRAGGWVPDAGRGGGRDRDGQFADTGCRAQGCARRERAGEGRAGEDLCGPVDDRGAGGPGSGRGPDAARYRFARSPVSGGVVGAKAGTLTIMVSGDAVAYETVRPALLEIGRNTVLVGDQVGQGQTLKLVNNLMAAANYAVASECLVLGAKAGLDADMMVDVINKSSGRSFVSETFVAKAVLSREFDFGFRLELMNKDIRLALEEAETLGIPMFTCSAARQLYAYAMALGAGPGDVTALIKVLEQWGNATVEGKGSQAA